MQNLLSDLVLLLEKDERLVSEGKLLKNKVVEMALSLDPSLLKLLLKHAGIKKHFFTEVDGVLVFDKMKFQGFVSNKQFLPDSYTAFKNKIGLTTDGAFLTDSNEVVLSWPYKDCVLEGGQTKEDAKRDEIFWNETLAPDQIDRLFAPKVLTSFKRYDKEGARAVKDISAEDNLLIKGNNLLALTSIKKRFAGRIKLIYIDPPYNTDGQDDSFNYNDSFNHSTWLTFMRNRLELAKELLAREGAIYIQLDYNEVHYCKVLLDEIFGPENFQREIIWRIGWISGYKSADKNWIRNHDTILFYSRNKDHLDFIKKHIPYPKGYVRRDGSRPEGEGYPYEDTWNCSDIDPLNSIAIVSFSKEKVGEFKGQKNEALLQRIIEAHTRKGEIVLDFFSGTGTTAAVAHKLGRQWISIEQIDEQIDKQAARLRKVMAGDKTGISKTVGWRGGGEFVFCELATANQRFVEAIRRAKTASLLQAIWKGMQEKAFLSYRIDGKSLAAINGEFANLPLEDQRRFLEATLDKNLLYVPFSEIEDVSYKFSKEDQALNKSFYSQQSHPNDRN
jgi:adenine-specific DNA-methyltransferase